MFVLHTGLQGNGKTLNTIREVDQKAAKENRVVYYHNIREFNVDHPAIKAEWLPFDNPHEWHKLPQNSIIVIDEAQTFFRVRKQGSVVPEYASALETMRHQGHELHCITQNPGLIDTHFRKLCNSHIHYVRGHKGKVIKRWSFERCNMDVEKQETFSNGESQRLLLDASYFGCYKSVADGAEHHFRFKLPKALYVLGVCLLLLGFAGWKIYDHRVRQPMLAAEAEASRKSTANPAVQVAPATSQATENRAMSTEEYIKANTPRIADIPDSAPVYDQLKQPVTYPKPFCVSTTNQDLLDRNPHRFTVGVHRGKFGGCFCNSQQGTKISISFAACMAIVENGYFDHAKPDRQPPVEGAAAGEPDGRAGRAAAAVPDSQQPRLPRVVVVADTSRDGRPLTPAQ